MIHYNVWFTFNPTVDEAEQLAHVVRLLEDFKSRDMIAAYRLLRNRGIGSKTRMPRFQVIIEFRDDEQFGLPFAEVDRTGVRGGAHGAMIEHVSEFVVEVFEEL